MNTRDYKIFRAGHFYHIYNRGDNRENIFLDDQDFAAFLIRLKVALGISVKSTLRIKPFPADSFTIAAYCLMPNHFHFLVRQNADASIGDLIKKLTTSYVKYFNAKHKRIGNLFQDTFKAKLIDSDSYLSYITAYIHNNPTDPFSYAYSSLPEYIGTRNGNLCNPEFILGFFKGNKELYKSFVQNYTLKDHEKIKYLVFDED